MWNTFQNRCIMLYLYTDIKELTDIINCALEMTNDISYFMWFMCLWIYSKWRHTWLSHDCHMIESSSYFVYNSFEVPIKTQNKSTWVPLEWPSIQQRALVTGTSVHHNLKWRFIMVLCILNLKQTPTLRISKDFATMKC